MTRTLLELDNDVAEFSRGVAETCSELGAKLSATMATLEQLKESVGEIRRVLSEQVRHLRDHDHKPAAQADAEPEQPKATPGKRIPPWVRAMQEIPDWMNNWEFKSPSTQCAGSHGIAALRNLHLRLKAVLQDDEQTRADLLAACKEALSILALIGRVSDEGAIVEDAVTCLNTAVTKAKETDR